jgi:hypothetical protein
MEVRCPPKRSSRQDENDGMVQITCFAGNMSTCRSKVAFRSRERTCFRRAKGDEGASERELCGGFQRRPVAERNKIDNEAEMTKPRN